MKILYHHRIASKDGQFTHIEAMVLALRALGHEVELVGPEVLRQDSGKGGSAGWVGRLKRGLPRGLYELAELAYSVVAWWRLMRAIRRFRPDAIYERYALYQPAGVWARRLSGLPLLLEVNAPYAIARRRYDGLALPRLADRVERFTFRGASRVLPVTQVLGDMLAGMGVDPARVVVVPNGIDPGHYAQLPSLDDAKARRGLSGRTVIGFIGFVREWDRLDRIVSFLAARPPGDDACLFIVGDGPVRPELEAQAAALGIAHKLHFTGVVPRAEVPAAAMAFDIALQTALVPYASPLCLFEYLALGKPVVAPDQPNHHEVLTRDRDCCMYDPAEPGGIERALQRLIEAPELRARLGEAARRTLVERGFYWEANARRVANAAQQAMAER